VPQPTDVARSAGSLAVDAIASVTGMVRYFHDHFQTNMFLLSNVDGCCVVLFLQALSRAVAKLFQSVSFTELLAKALANGS